MWVLLLITTLGRADEPPTPPAPPPDPPVTTAGEIRLIGSLPPDFPVDAEGHRVGQGFVLDHRVRASLDYAAGSFRAGTEWDVLSGQAAGDTWDLPVGIDDRMRGQHTAYTLQGVVPRRIATGMRLSVVDIEAGLTTSNWGLGLLSNDGSGDPLFGRTDGGDRVLRARATTAPFRRGDAMFPLYLTLAGDAVISDEMARWSRGQRATQAIASALYKKPDGAQLGTYLVARNQRELEAGRVTDAFVADITGEVPVSVGAWTLRLATEAALIAGHTDRALSYTARERLGVGAGAVLVHTALTEPDARLTAHLRGGWTSGDGDPDDGGAHDFTADPNVDVGMVLFDELGGGIEVGTVALLSDPQYSGQPPDGVEALSTQGGWRRSAFLQPAVEGTPITGLDLRAGMVLAWATGPVAQPFYSFRAGGSPHNHLERPTEGYALGTEVDWAVEVGRDATEDWTIHPTLLVQGGHAMPSDNFAGPGMPERLDLIMMALRGRW